MLRLACLSPLAGLPGTPPLQQLTMASRMVSPTMPHEARNGSGGVFGGVGDGESVATGVGGGGESVATGVGGGGESVAEDDEP